MNVEIKQEYSILFNAITDAIGQLENLPIHMPEIEECIQMLKEAQQAAEEMNISADKGG